MATKFVPPTTKRCHLPPGVTSLEVLCLRDGTLDVDLETGDVFSVRGDKRTKRKLDPDDDGYLCFWLNRERKDRRGKAERDGNRKRYRYRRVVLAHRLVKIKHLAVAKGGSKWRQYATDLPRGVDVNHIDRVRHHNWADNLELQTEAVNRARGEMTEQEIADLEEFLYG